MRRRRSFYVLVALALALSMVVALGVARTRGSDAAVLIIAVAGSIGAATVAWRLADSTETALRQADQGREELALVGRLSAGLSGPLKPPEVANPFLDGIKRALPPPPVPALRGQYVARALHNALSIAEADDRADREAVVNRIAQRIYSNLDPDAVVRSALEELGTELGVSRVVISGAGDADLTVLHEWHAEGVTPAVVGTHGQPPLSTLAIREGRTIAVRDARTDARLTDA